LFPLSSEAAAHTHPAFEKFPGQAPPHSGLPKETGILLPDNQRQHRTSHAPKDVLPLRMYQEMIGGAVGCEGKFGGSVGYKGILGC